MFCKQPSTQWHQLFYLLALILTGYALLIEVVLLDWLENETSFLFYAAGIVIASAV